MGYREDVIDWGDHGSQYARRVCVESFKNSPAVQIFTAGTGFRDGVSWNFSRPVLQGMMDGTIHQTGESDGAGGKPQFFALMNDVTTFSQLGWEIIVMDADDVARRFGLPVMMFNQVDTRGLNERNIHLFRAMMDGYGMALHKTQLVNPTGELAIMKTCITGLWSEGHPEMLVLTWNGSCLGFVQHPSPYSLERVVPDLPLVGLLDPSYRCNGGGIFARCISKEFGETAHEIMSNGRARQLLEQLTRPSVCFAPLISRLVGWKPDGTKNPPLVDIRGIAHITGGGILGKLPEILPDGVGAELDSLPVPPECMLWAQDVARGSDLKNDEACYRAFHGGPGMILVAGSTADAMQIIREAADAGYVARLVGYTIASRAKEMVIESRFRDGGILTIPTAKAA